MISGTQLMREANHNTNYSAFIRFSDAKYYSSKSVLFSFILRSFSEEMSCCFYWAGLCATGNYWFPFQRQLTFKLGQTGQRSGPEGAAAATRWREFIQNSGEKTSALWGEGRDCIYTCRLSHRQRLMLSFCLPVNKTGIGCSLHLHMKVGL